MFKAFLSLSNPFVISKPKVSRRNILKSWVRQSIFRYRLFTINRLYWIWRNPTQTSFVSKQRRYWVMYSVRTESIKGLFTWKEGYPCARRVTLPHGPTLPALLTCFVMCVVLCNDPRFKKILKLFRKTRKIHEKGKILSSWTAQLMYFTGPKLVWGEAQKDEKEQRRCWWPSYDWIIRWNLVSNCIRLFQRVLMRISTETKRIY